MGSLGCVWSAATSALIESLLTTSNLEAFFQFIKSSAFQVFCAPDYGMLNNCVLTGWSLMSSAGLWTG